MHLLLTPSLAFHSKSTVRDVLDYKLALLLIYPMFRNNATLKIDFTDPWKRNFVRNLFYKNTFSMEHPMWLLLVLQVYLHQIINLNTNVLKVFQVFYNSFLVRDYYVCKKSKFLTSQSLPMHAYTKWLILKKEKLSTPLSFIFILKKWDWLKILDLSILTLANKGNYWTVIMLDS